MSNVLTPIVAKYSLFFTLSMYSSSSISRSKQPTHLVQTLLFEAQQRYQDQSSEKLRALIRHLSTTSTSSSSLSQSAVSQLSSGSTEISSPSSFQPVVSSSPSSSTYRLEPPSSFSHLPLDQDMPSFPPVLEQEVAKCSVVAHNKPSEHHCIKNKDNNSNSNSNSSINNNTSTSLTLIATLNAKEQTYLNNNHSNNGNNNHSNNGNNNHNHNNCPSYLPAAATATVASTVSSDRLDQHQISSLSSSPSISVAAVRNKLHQLQQQPAAATRHDQQGSNKVSKSSIAALLSVTLTMILLSLLQSKKRHFRRKGRSPRGTASKRHSRGSRQILQLHQDGYKSASTDQFTPRSHSPSSSHTNLLLLTDSNNNIMESTSSESARSLLTQYRPASFFGGHGSEPTLAFHNQQQHPSSLSPPTHGPVPPDSNNSTGIPLLSSKKSYPLNTLHNESTTPLSHQGNMYSGRDLGYSLSDSNLPDRRSKRDLVVDWLDQQTFVAPETAESPESILLAQGCLNIGHGNDPLQQLLPAQYYQQQQQQQQQQLTLSHQLGFAAQLDPNQLYLQQHSINNTGAQREPRQEHHRSIQRSNDLYPGSRTPVYRTPSTTRHSMVALDQQQQQPNPRLSQPQMQQQQLSSTSSFWRDSPSQPQPQAQSQQQQQVPHSHQYRPPYSHYPQKHPPYPQHPLPHYTHHQQQYQQPTPPPSSFHSPTYEPCVHDDFDQQNPSHRRSLSLNNPGGRGGARSRPQSQVYRKATPARFENLSLAEQARQEHQMRRQHYQQQYYQHRQQHQHQHQHQLYQHQHQLYQHQQYYQAPGSRPESMYSNAPAAPRIHTMGSTLPRENQFVPPRQYHQQPYPRPHPPTQQQQHRHNSDLHHSSVSSPKGSSVSRSAHDLAWERHCYYQQQQIQEDALAERRRIEQQQQQRKAQRPLSSVEGLQVPLLQGSSSVMRTSSMSRISNSSTTAVAGGKMSSSLGRLAGGEMVAHQNSSSGLSRSVSTSAIMDAKHRAAKKDKTTSGSSGANLKKSNIKESLADENEAKSTSMFDECKFLRLLRRSDSKLSKMNTEKPSASTQAHSIGTSSEERLKVPVVITTQPLGSTPSPSATAAATPGLNRRRTLKDLAPSIRSLARRCSSRFSSNSSRPNSFAGSSSDPVIQLSEEKGGPRATSGGVRGSHSLSMTTSYLPLKLSLSSLPRSLTPGPDGVVDLQHAAGSDDHQSMPSSPLSVKYFPLTSTSTSFVSLVDKPASPPLVSTPDKEQGIPIHRKVTLFRSKTMSLAKSSPPSSSRDKTTPATLTSDTIDTTPSDSTNSMADDDDNANTKNSSRANSLPSRRRPQRDSLRLANGHGLDFNTFLPPISVTTSFSTISAGTTSSVAADDEQASAVERSTNNLESALPARSSLDPAPVAIVTSSRLSDMDQQQKARRQIISLLAMGRKDRISAKTGHVMKNGTSSSSQPSTPTTGSSPTTPVSQLTPLALEAQEDLFVTRTASEVAGGQKDKQGEEDPVERIAFMLVPKSRYEFQPLVVA